MDYMILVINPGSTSTKIALYKNEEEVFKESIEHPHDEMDKYSNLLQEVPMRKRLVLEALEKHGYKPEDLSVVMGRGGLLPPIKIGGYKVNDKMLDLILGEKIPSHASNLGAVLADDIAKMNGIPAYIYDGVSSGELMPIAKITGMKEIERKSFYHVLNSRAVARWYAESKGKKYEDFNLLVAHLGGGITVGAHKKGKIIDSLSDDNGPFAPERSGGVPLLDIIDMCYSGQYSKQEMQKKVRSKGGLRDLLGTSNVKDIMKMVEAGDKKAILVMQAQAYQIAKGIAILAPALKGQIDAIILTGGLANNAVLVNDIKDFIGWLAPIEVLPGEHEMQALALGGLRILRKEEQVHEM